MTARERMDRKLRTKRGRALYRQRGAAVEPVFGQMKDRQGADRFSMRGLARCRGEWQLDAAVHNFRKLHREFVRCARSRRSVREKSEGSRRSSFRQRKDRHRAHVMAKPFVASIMPAAVPAQRHGGVAPSLHVAADAAHGAHHVLDGNSAQPVAFLTQRNRILRDQPRICADPIGGRRHA